MMAQSGLLIAIKRRADARRHMLQLHVLRHNSVRHATQSDLIMPPPICRDLGSGSVGRLYPRLPQAPVRRRNIGTSNTKL
jgi:hypothetical protein